MTPDYCPHCGASLQGEPIPQEYIDAGYYAEGTTHYSVVVGHEVSGVYDGVLFWVDPACGMAWSRWTGGGWMAEMAEMAEKAAAYIAEHNAALTEAA